jgi:hypothetical protein
LTDNELIEAYDKAMGAYQAAKAGTGCRVDAFTDLLVAETVLTARLGVDKHLESYRERYSP